MRAIALILAALLLLGCINLQRAENNTTQQNQSGLNLTNASANQTAPAYLRYNASGFSFDFPSDMTYQGSGDQSSGRFTAIHGLGSQTFEIMIVSYVDTISAYGKNKDEQYKLDASQAASDFLEQDRTDDSAGVLDKADSVGNASIYSIARDAGAAEVPIKTHFGSLEGLYTGYAMDIYIPERSVLLRVRILSLDQSKADQIRQEFILSLRPE